MKPSMLKPKCEPQYKRKKPASQGLQRSPRASQLRRDKNFPAAPLSAAVTAHVRDVGRAGGDVAALNMPFAAAAFGRSSITRAAQPAAAQRGCWLRA
jgi:hypothetical protein